MTKIVITGNLINFLIESVIFVIKTENYFVLYRKVCKKSKSLEWFSRYGSTMYMGPPWNNINLAKTKNKKNKMFKKYKKTGSSISLCNYLIARSEYNIINKSSYKNYLIRMKSQLKSNLFINL